MVVGSLLKEGTYTLQLHLGGWGPFERTTYTLKLLFGSPLKA